jgi:hypothetical protein
LQRPDLLEIGFLQRMLAQRFAALEIRLQRPQQCRLFDACRIGLLLLLLRDAVEPQLHEAEIGNGELEIHHLDVAQWIDGAARVKHRIVFERANDVAERVHVLQLTQPLLAVASLGGAGASVHSISAYFVFFGLYSALSLSMRGSVTLNHADGVIARAGDQLLVRHTGH